MPLELVLILGFVEGLTEFIPVSSTGHLLLLGHFLGFESPGKTFEVLIQLGAVCAIVTVYVRKFWGMAMAMPYEAAPRNFALGVLIAFLPAAVIGATAHSFIKEVLFESPALVCTTLILGGIALLLIDRMAPTPKHFDAFSFPPSLAFKIGLCQCLALIPGVSRSGATIGGALLLGVDKRAAAEFSFFLALPTMAGAFAYDLYKNWAVLNWADAEAIALGFLIAFITAVIVVRTLLDFVSRHGFAPFAYWRIAVGLVGFIGLGLGY